MLIGKIGAVTPILTQINTNVCTPQQRSILARLKNGSPDQMVVFWFDDESINYGTFGQTLPGIVLTRKRARSPHLMETLQCQAGQIADPSNQMVECAGRLWRGFRVDATIQNTSFAFDWIRLTDCNPVNISIPWSGTGPVSVSITPYGTTRDILVASNVYTTPYVLDAQGLQVGTYNYYVRKGTTLITTGIFKVKPAAHRTARKSIPHRGQSRDTLGQSLGYEPID